MIFSICDTDNNPRWIGSFATWQEARKEGLRLWTAERAEFYIASREPIRLEAMLPRLSTMVSEAIERIADIDGNVAMELAAQIERRDLEVENLDKNLRLAVGAEFAALPTAYRVVKVDRVKL